MIIFPTSTKTVFVTIILQIPSVWVNPCPDGMEIGLQSINIILPQYISIDIKPENGCDIHNAADGFSGIIVQLNLVKTSSDEDLHSPEEHYGLLYGTKVMLNILQPCVNKQRRVVSADS